MPPTLLAFGTGTLRGQSNFSCFLENPNQGRVLILDGTRIPPSNRLEALKGDRKGKFSIRINQQWRICFRWDNGDAHEVVITGGPASVRAGAGRIGTLFRSPRTSREGACPQAPRLSNSRRRPNPGNPFS